MHYVIWKAVDLLEWQASIPFENLDEAKDFCLDSTEVGLEFVIIYAYSNGSVRVLTAQELDE